jgi:transcriptional regulator with XRE-family HTH domain
VELRGFAPLTAGGIVGEPGQEQQAAIGRLEAGRVAPSLNTLDRAAAALGVELVITFQEPQRRDRRQLSG